MSAYGNESMARVVQAEAAYDQRSFDIARRRAKEKKRLRRETLFEYTAVAVGIAIAIYVTFYVYSSAIFRLMPDPLQ